MAADYQVQQLMEAMESMNTRIRYLEAAIAEGDNPGKRRGLLDKSVLPSHFLHFAW